MASENFSTRLRSTGYKITMGRNSFYLPGLKITLKASDCRVAVQSLRDPEKVAKPREGPNIGTKVCKGFLVLIITKDQ